ncbi:MAG: hypothetical protein INQ03_06065 [Candidatus Heimdallarchaeota archaeon]|nr:hypothetical protein [Candidatus Heimdallarchaeota archaeon]
MNKEMLNVEALDDQLLQDLVEFHSKRFNRINNIPIQFFLGVLSFVYYPLAILLIMYIVVYYKSKRRLDTYKREVYYREYGKPATIDENLIKP